MRFFEIFDNSAWRQNKSSKSYFYFFTFQVLKKLGTFLLLLDQLFGRYFYFYLSNFLASYLYFYLSTQTRYLLQHWQFSIKKLKSANCALENRLVNSQCTPNRNMLPGQAGGFHIRSSIAQCSQVSCKITLHWTWFTTDRTLLRIAVVCTSLSLSLSLCLSGGRGAGGSPNPLQEDLQASQIGWRPGVTLHAPAKLHQAKCSGSWVIVLKEKRTPMKTKTIQPVATAWTVKL